MAATNLATALLSFLCVFVEVVDVTGASDDVSLSSLKANLDQQTAVIETQAAQLLAQGAQLTALQNEVSDLSAARHKQVAFSVTFPNTVQHPLNVGANAAVKFDTVVTNEGSGYSAQTGLFTAPYAGIYAFYLSLRSHNQHGWVTLGVYQGDRVLIRVVADGSGHPFDKGNGFVTTHLRQGEHIDVRHDAGDTFIETGPLTTFSGLLVSPD